jgi:hypothetical protein
MKYSYKVNPPDHNGAQKCYYFDHDCVSNSTESVGELSFSGKNRNC